MEDAKSATEAVFQNAIDAFNDGDIDGFVNCYHEKCVVLTKKHGVVLKDKTGVHDFVPGELPRITKKSLKETMDFHMLCDEFAVGCYRVDTHDDQGAIIDRCTDLVVWQKVAGAWVILRVMYATLI